MEESAVGVIQGEDMPQYERQIEIRLALPTGRVRYEKGQAVREAGPDPEWVISFIQPGVERALQRVYGPETEIRFSVGKTMDVRLSGVFPVKAGEIKERVAGVLEEAFENMENPEG